MPAHESSVGILGTGRFLPQKVLTNFDLEKMVVTSNDWIIKRTGIEERRILEDGMPSHSMGVNAAKLAIEDAGITAEDLDMIIVATEAPDYLTPSMSCLIQKELGALKAAAFDLNAACSGFVYSLTVASQFISSGYYKYILIIGNEALSRIVDFKDRNTCVLLGDGAGAAVVGPVSEGYGIRSTNLGAEGNLGNTITIPCCFASPEDMEKRHSDNRMVIWMDGSEVFKFAVRALVHAVELSLADAGLSMNDIKLLVPHQANLRIIDGAVKRLNIDESRVYKNINKYGNTSSASIPIAVDEANKSGLISKGDHILLVGFGGGLTWASVVIKWGR